jgi:zinc protease
MPSSVDSSVQANPEWPIVPATPGTIVKEEELAQDVTRWTLSNGLQVFYRYSDQTPGKVYYELSGVHGLNSLSQPETFAARLALPTLGTSGLREMNGSQLSAWLNANGLVQMPTFSFFQRGMYGSGPSDKFPVMMRLLHVALTEAQVDDATWRHIRNQNREQLGQIDGHPHEPWLKMVEQTLYRNDDALKTLTLDELNRISPVQIQAVYDSYFSGTQNYQLSVVGDADKKAVRESIIEAMATLPERSADWSTPRDYPEPEASVSHTVAGSGEQAATVVLRYSLPKSAFPDQELITFRLLESWIDQALFQEIRENKGYVYSISSSLDGATIAQTDFTLIIQLATDPSNVGTVVEKIRSELAALPDQPASQRQINQWHQTLQQDFQQVINGAEQQAEALAYAPMYGQNPVNALVFNPEPPATPQQLSDLAALFMGTESKAVELIWMP